MKLNSLSRTEPATGEALPPTPQPPSCVAAAMVTRFRIEHDAGVTGMPPDRNASIVTGMELSLTFYATDRERWRAWLEQHHADTPEVWLVYSKAHTGQPCVSYEDSVEEALCFGWVDSLIRKIDEKRYARKFTPRRPGSNWSQTNERRAAKAISEGRMTPAGLAKLCGPPAASPTPIARSGAELPEWLAAGLRSSTLAWENFTRLPPSHQRRYVAWLSDAKKEETRQKRLKDAISLLEANKRLGIGPGEVRR